MREAPAAGFLVTGVNPGSIAQTAGLLEGDIITSYRGLAIPNQNALGKAMTGVQPNEPIAIEVFRNGQTQPLAVKPGQLWQIGVNGRFARPALR
ncbi:PDZ domain-containing protein [bacterium]|nr:PDZ domain-containing protein [bacterium]